MLTESQFNQLLEKITRSQEEHDLLVEMKSSMETYQVLTLNRLEHHTKEISAADKKSGDAHQRLDRVIVAGGLTVFLTVSGMIISVIGILSKIPGGVVN